MSYRNMGYGVGDGRVYSRGAKDHHFYIHERPDYTPEENQQVVDWLNGRDQPLRGMVGTGNDPFYFGQPITPRGILVRDFPPLPSEV